MVTNEVNKQKNNNKKKKRERLEISWDGSWKSLFFPAIHNFGMTKRRTNMFRLLTLHNFLPLSEKTQSNTVQKIFIHTMQVMFQANRSTYSLKCMNCSKKKATVSWNNVTQHLRCIGDLPLTKNLQSATGND